MDWLTPTDYATQQSDLLSRRQEGTGLWLLQSDDFHAWQTQDRKTLFCPGIPGAGKTFITSIVVDHLCTEYQNDASIAVIYLFCNFRRQQEQTPTDLLLSLLKQLTQERTSVPDCVQALHVLHKDKRTRPSLIEIVKAIKQILAEFSKTYIMVDALDEYQVPDGGRDKFLKQLFDFQNQSNVNLFMTARPIPEIQGYFEGCTRLGIRADREDILQFIDGRMSRLPSFVTRNLALQEEIKDIVADSVDGM